MAVLNMATPLGNIAAFALTGFIYADISNNEATMTDEEFRAKTI